MIQSCHVELPFLVVPLLLGYHRAALEIIAVTDCRVGAEAIADCVQCRVGFLVLRHFWRGLSDEVGPRGGAQLKIQRGFYLFVLLFPKS